MLVVLLMSTSTLSKLISVVFFFLFLPLSTDPDDCFSMCYIAQSRFISAKFSLPLIGLSCKMLERW